MCNPALAMMAISAASSAAQMASQNAQAKAQAKAINHQNEVKADEIADQASVEMNERQREAQREQARIRVAAGESGLSGPSLDIALGNTLFQSGFDQALTVKNESNRQRARNAEARSNMAGLQIRSGANIVLNAAGAGASAYYQNGGGKSGK